METRFQTSIMITFRVVFGIDNQKNLLQRWIPTPSREFTDFSIPLCDPDIHIESRTAEIAKIGFLSLGQHLKHIGEYYSP